MPSCVFDLRDAESYLTVGTSRAARMGGQAEGLRPRRGLAWARRASRCEKTPLDIVHRRSAPRSRMAERRQPRSGASEQEVDEICGLDAMNR